ncbi:MAG: hypothetical protein U0L18_04165 [Acutalibacteraceae bacterium]|nr:hypothetical protein [Acutalibacteraceae bacterium]
MTSTISSNNTKKPFLSMLLWSLKKALPITLVYSFLLFVCYPMYIILSRNSYGPERFNYARCQIRLLEIVPLIIGVFTIIIACSMFSVYHKKRSMDLYASLPINKTTLFLAKYVSGLLVIIVPLVVFMSLGLFVSCQVNSINTFVTYFRMLGYVVSIINMYSMLSLLAIICGGKVDTLITFAVINVGVAGCLLTAANLVASIVPGMFNMDVEIYQPFTFMLLFSFAPFAMPYLSGEFSSVYAGSDGKLVNYVSDEWFVAESKILVIWFVIAVAYLVAGMIMAKKRKNENVQNGFIFEFPKAIIQAVATVSAGVMIGSFLAGNNCTKNDGFKTMLMFMLGALIGSVLAYLIVTLIYNKGIKRFKKGLPAFVGSFVAVVVFYLTISLGWVGVTDVPKVENIKSACVLGENDNRFNTSLVPVVYSNGNNLEKVDRFIEDKDVIKNTVALHQAIVDGLHEESGTFFNFYNYYTAGKGATETGYEPYTIRIEYELNNGKKISKTYIHGHFNYDKIKDKYNAIISSELYKQECYKVARYATAEESNVYKINIYTNANNDYEPSDMNDSNAINQVYSTLREEFIADKNHAETLEANYSDNELIFSVGVYYSLTESAGDDCNIDAIIERDAEKLDIIPGEVDLDPNDTFVITEDTYPKTWALLNSYCNECGTGEIHMFTNHA